MKKIQIGVIGYNQNSLPIPLKTLDIAYEVGKEIAKKNAVLICGGLGGVMEFACKGAKDNGGLTVGIVPQEDSFQSNEFCDIVICTGIGKSRDFIVSYSSDGIISVGGGVGTLIELCVGYMVKKIMVSIEDSGGTSDLYGGKFLDERKRIKIEHHKTPSNAVDFIIDKLRCNKRKQ
ncbi:MAG: TIGR00725 family protein [Candidatus Nitrosocosmicus sp.]